MMIRIAQDADLPVIVDIYNTSIPGRKATADTEPVTVESRRTWFADFDPLRRPLWVSTRDEAVEGWLSLRSFYGRPAYHATVEVAVYVAPAARRRGVARRLVEHALRTSPQLAVRTVLAFVFGHNEASLALFQRLGFERWGCLPGIAELDGNERDLVILGHRIGA